MNDQIAHLDGSLPPKRPTTGRWTRPAILLLTVEKTVQHLVVTTAFFFDWGGIRSTVAIAPDILMVAGALVAILFGLSVWGVVGHRLWSYRLVVGLALFDILGEFVAQGKMGITLTVSFVVAVALLFLSAFYLGRRTSAP